ncbi:BON domain-containing protein [Rickettsiales bacterium]|nr:BON domain-containing protein [Rickettsiales bacterium]
MPMKKITLVVISSLFLSGCAALLVGGTAATVGVVAAQERSAGQAVDDLAIMAQIKHLYLQKNAQDLLAGVDVEVIEGRVYLTGAVNTIETRIDAVKLAWQPKKVKEVVNEIQVSQKKSLKVIASDLRIESQLNSLLLLQKGVSSLNYSTEVVNGVVYLMGLASSKHELNTVTDLARRINGVKKVISHVRLKREPARS